jgi:catechol 2,3-dioxygenase-like lactoylglutathione lyase family enzyme
MTAPTAPPTSSAADSPISGFSHVQLLVSDVQASQAWYATALGLTKFAGSAEAGYVAMSGAGGRLAVVLSPRPDGIGAPPGVDHLAFAVADVARLQAWAERLTAAGIQHGGLVESGEGTSVHLTDPDGLHLELIAARRG